MTAIRGINEILKADCTGRGQRRLPALLIIFRLREKPCLLSYFLTFSSRLWIMEQVFSDILGLFGAEIEEDDGYVYYGGLKLGVVPKV